MLIADFEKEINSQDLKNFRLNMEKQREKNIIKITSFQNVIKEPFKVSIPDSEKIREELPLPPKVQKES